MPRLLHHTTPSLRPNVLKLNLYIGARQQAEQQYKAAQEAQSSGQSATEVAKKYEQYGVTPEAVQSKLDIMERDPEHVSTGTSVITVKTPAGETKQYLSTALPYANIPEGSKQVPTASKFNQRPANIIEGRKPVSVEQPTVLFSEKAYGLVQQRQPEIQSIRSKEQISITRPSKYDDVRNYYETGMLPIYGGQSVLVQQKPAIKKYQGEVRLAETKPTFLQKLAYKESIKPGYGVYTFPIFFGVGFAKGVVAPFTPSFYKGIGQMIRHPVESFSGLGAKLLATPGATLGEMIGYAKGSSVPFKLLSKIKQPHITLKTGVELRTVKDITTGKSIYIKETAFKATTGLLFKKQIKGLGKGIVTVDKSGKYAGAFKYSIDYFKGNKLLRSVKSQVAIKGIAKTKPGELYGLSISQTALKGKGISKLVPSINAVKAQQYISGEFPGYMTKAGTIGKMFTGSTKDITRQYTITRKLFEISPDKAPAFEIWRSFGKQLTKKQSAKIIGAKRYPIMPISGIGGGIPLVVTIPKPTPKLQPEPIIAQEFIKGFERSIKQSERPSIKFIPVISSRPSIKAINIIRMQQAIKPISRVKPITKIDTKLSPVIDLSPKLDITPMIKPKVVQRINQTPDIKKYLRLVSVQDTYNPIPPIPPPQIPKIPMGLYPFPLPGKSISKRKLKKSERSFRYMPNLQSVANKWYGKKPMFLTGIEQRFI